MNFLKKSTHDMMLKVVTNSILDRLMFRTLNMTIKKMYFLSPFLHRST